MDGQRRMFAWRFALAFVMLMMVVATPHAASAAPGALLKTVNIPAGAQCVLGEGVTTGTAVAIVPGGKLALPSIPILLVTSCVVSGQAKLFFLDPSTDPATLVKTLNTTVTPAFGWEALALRPDKGDLIGCGTVSGQTAMYGIDILPAPFNNVTDGTATFLRNGPTGSTCRGLAWDVTDNSIYQSSTNSASPPDAVPVAVLHLTETGTTTLGSVSSGCDVDGGVAVAGPNLFTACPPFEGSGTISQRNKATGNGVTSFSASTASPGDLECDPVSFGASNKDAIWVKDLFSAQAVAVEAPFGACGPIPPPPACPTGDLDSDGDGLLDCWEDALYWNDGRPGIALDGVWLPGRDPNEGGIPRRFTMCVPASGTGAQCSSVTQKDLYLELDYMTGQTPSADAVSQVVAAFNNAPADSLSCPGCPGPINLHVLVDDQIPSSPRIALVPCTGAADLTRTPPDADFDTLKAAWFGTTSERSNPAMLAMKRFVYHYGIFATNQVPIPPAGSTTSSGCSEILGNDFIVTLGSWTGGTGSVAEQAGTLMHEFGHNLSLRHGGSDNLNCKSNYTSIMSYHLQMPNTIADRPLDFSRQLFATLKEGTLNEGVGIGGFPFGYSTTTTGKVAFGPLVGVPPKPTVVSVASDGSINWDKDSNLKEVSVSRDVSSMTSSTGGCAPLAGQTLTGFNDWANIKFNFRASTDFGDGAGYTTRFSIDGLTGLDKHAGSLEISLEEALQLSMDIVDVKPHGDKKNTVVLHSSHDVPVAMYGREGVDVTTLDKSTLTLRGLPPATWVLAVEKDSKGNFLCSVKDDNFDGFLDLICRFDLTPIAGTLTAGEQIGIIEGTTSAGYFFRGSDSINFLP